ncbi:16S rRNA methyltransferase [Candidatus Francisella endociliophora]|uniref:16S rRNA (cytosine(967)-C(5))-methyltransferase n=1 Tax=Candidatus Francisella endociliophora TaxID=653937 RepID=A0A097ER99_9GAMM|nr:16S rRNA (cytosine(967)-C(5))-methyltransferase RsmB [Francisella sp. FSC1006]AIT10067.1 16S rRNA methyltransferase [Francisella sp. FSC1006]
MNTRALAAKSILDILEKKYSLLTLDSKLCKLNISDQDKSFVKLLCYEFFRNFYSLKKIIDSLISKKTKFKAKVLIMLGALQIFEINQPLYASINETVSACKSLKILWAKKLVNGVLREISRDIDLLTQNYNNYKKIDMPNWLVDMLKKQYHDNYFDIIKASNSKANMFIRLNESKDTKVVLDYFEKNQIVYADTELKNCLKLDKAIDVKSNKLFQQGYFTIQDLSAQYMGHIIKPSNNDKILDACAAPGGKTTQVLELAPKAQITAIDVIDKRLELLKDNVNRISPNKSIDILKHDLTEAFTGKFDKIILDAPCSALGTIKRNPDIKILRTVKDIEDIQALQNKILQNLWNNNLEGNGYLLYITCSILKQENQDQIKSFIEKNQNAEIAKIEILKKYKIDIGYQIPPSINKGDGFYYCLLKKVSYP